MNFFVKSKSSRFRERHEKTYIIPTSYGAAFGFICILLFGIAFASTNNAVYFLCFFMVSLGSQSLILTNRNIDKLRIAQWRIDDFFADEVGQAVIIAHNPTLENIESVLFEFSKDSRASVERIKAGEHYPVKIPFKVTEPGLQTVPYLKISSEFPYHFSRSWKKHYHELKVYVYPPRQGTAAFAKAAYYNEALEAQSFDDFKGHREYQNTDAPRSIDWRVSARVQKIMVKEFSPQESRKVTLRWEDCPQSTDADRKSQLSLWIDLAEKNNFEYALETPTKKLGFGRGPQHKTDCLRSLL